MPTRMIREGFLDSEKINSLSTEEQNFFIRLLLIVDDYGRVDARPALLKSKCYPVTDIRPSIVSNMLTTLYKAKLIVLYACNDKNYLEIVQFNQRLRQKNERYPSPGEGDCCQLPDSCPTIDSDMRLEEKRREEELEEKKKKKKENIYRKFDKLSMTIEEFNKLRENHTKEDIDDILDRIENFKQNGKYKSLYRTAITWLKTNYGNVPTKTPTYKIPPKPKGLAF